MSNIRFPDGMQALKKYPGYFWDPVERKLYSIKVDGVLKPLKLQYSSYMKRNYGVEYYYSISINGKSKMILPENIDKYLNKKKKHYIPKQTEFNFNDNYTA